MNMRSSLALDLMHPEADRLSKSADMEIWPDSLFKAGAWPADIYLMAARLMQLQQQPGKAASAFQAVIAVHGNTTALLSMQTKAHIGLAFIARDAGQNNVAWHQAKQALAICHHVGMPRLTAHALLLQGQLNAVATVSNSDLRVQKLERVLSIYSNLADLNGQKQSLILLQKLADPESDKAVWQRYQLRLQQLDAKLGK